MDGFELHMMSELSIRKGTNRPRGANKYFNYRSSFDTNTSGNSTRAYSTPPSDYSHLNTMNLINQILL